MTVHPDAHSAAAPVPTPSHQVSATGGRPRILLTGATRGIGLALAETLAAGPDRPDLVLVGRRPDAVLPLAERLDATPLVLDLAEPAGLAGALAAGAPAGAPDADAVVHAAGVEGTAAAADLVPEHLARVLAVNLTGPVELTRLLLPGLRRRRGHVVVLGSTAVLAAPPVPGWAAYAAAKAGLRAWTDTLRVEEAAHGVRVSTVLPGRTDTDMQRDIAAARGTTFDPRTAMSAVSVARAVAHVLAAPADAVVEETRIAPAPR